MHLSLLIFIAWLIYMFISHQWYLFISHWIMSLVMIAGSFIAGSTAESGGAFAFPVMTLIFNIPPDVVRNFSLAIQSIGMTSASFYIFTKKIPIDRKYLFLSTIGGTAGIIIGTVFILHLVSPEYIKMLFFSFWLSFAFVLFYLNQIKKREVNESLPDLNNSQKTVLIVIGVFGGILTSILGSGLDIFTFSYVTMRYNLSEKVATPTSVIIMTFNSIAGVLLHIFIFNGIGAGEFDLLKVCIPVVIFGAPLGVYFVYRVKRTQIARLLYIILLLQFIIAFIFIKPSGSLLIFSIFVFFFGIIIFSYFGKVFLLTAVLERIFIPERFAGRTFAWDIQTKIGYNTGSGFWKEIFRRRYWVLLLFCLWIASLFIFTRGNIFILLKSPVPVLIIIVAIISSMIANSTAADGGMLFLPALSIIFLSCLPAIDFFRSYFSYQVYTLPAIIITIQITQSFGMLSGSISWWRSGVKILIKENILNLIGVCIGVIIAKYYLIVNEEAVYKAFGSWNLIMFFIIVYNLIIVKTIPNKTKWPGRFSWIFLLVGMIGGVIATWTSIGVGSLTSFVLILLLKPEISIANGSIMMALSSIVIVAIDFIFLKKSLPLEIVLFTIPAVIIGGFSAPYLSMWFGKKFCRLLLKADPSIELSAKGEKISKNILEYTSGQLVMQISFIIVCLYNSIYYLFVK